MQNFVKLQKYNNSTNVLVIVETKQKFNSRITDAALMSYMCF